VLKALEKNLVVYDIERGRQIEHDQYSIGIIV
jgi:hypothetical protein